MSGTSRDGFASCFWCDHNRIVTEKEQLHRLIDSLSEEDAIEEMQYRLYVLWKIKRGLKSIDEGKGLEHEQVVRQLAELFD